MTTKINKIIIFVGILISSLFLNSCDSYLDRQPDDALTIEMIFQKRATTQKYLISVYSYIIEESRSSFTTPYIGASDEASISYPNRGYTYMNNGSWSPDGPPYQEFWDQYYQGIREASFFMQKVGTCPELTSEEISQWTAEARFIRAFLYASMMRLYGPVILTGNDPVDFTNADLNKERATWDECVNYVCQELNEVAAILPEKQDVYWAGKPTKGAALAVKARLLLYSARPLFNGNSMYKDMISTDGKHLFSVEKDAKKWELAAQANKEVIDLNYQLYKDDLRDPIKSYQGIYLKLWNEELIWARAISGYEWRIITTPRGTGGIAYGGVSPTQKAVDAFAMSNGRYPIIGYKEDGKTPIIDPKSGYTEGTFEDLTHPIDGSTRNTNSMYIDREPRFYASVCWSGETWKFGTDEINVQFYYGGNSGPGSSHNYPKPGYLIRKMSDHSLNIKNKEYGRFSWPLFRLGEIYLNYAEALNECDPGNTDILKYINLIRERSGMPALETIYPQDVKDQNTMRELIRRERQVELAFEGHRYFDTRTWMIAEKTDNGPMYGMNIMAKNDTPDGGFWERTEFETRIFTSKHYLFPISQKVLDRNKKLTQNYLW